MLEEGTVIKVQLPDRGTVTATVLKCSKQGKNCKLHLENEEEVSVNISKCAYTLLKSSPGPGLNAIGDTEIANRGAAPNGTFQSADVIDQLLSTLEGNAAALLKPSETIAALARNAAKAIFELGNNNGAGTAAASGGGDQSAAPAATQLQQLYVEGFDPEQIWLQLDMAALPAIKKAKKFLKKGNSVTRLVPEDVEDALDELLLEASDGSDSDEDSDLDSDLDIDEENEDDELNEKKGRKIADLDYDALLAAAAAEEEESDSEDEEEERVVKKQKQLKKVDKKALLKKKKLTNEEALAVVEDEFMKLDEMEAFLKQAEQEEQDLDDLELEGGKKASDNEEESEDEDVQAPIDPEQEDSDADLEALLDHAAALTGKKVPGKDKKKKNKKKKRVTFSGLGSEDENSESGSDSEADDIYKNATYEDFFGPRATGPSATAKRALQDAVHFDQLDHDNINDQSRREAKRARRALRDESSDEDDVFDFDNPHGEESEEEDSEGEDFLDEEERGYDQDEEESEEESEDEELRPSTHERRLAKTAERVKRLENEAMGAKDWYLQGEVDASIRPKNSALELDMEFDTTVKPPPQPTEESTKSLEDLIRSRITEGKFDDVLRVLPTQQPQKKGVTVELNDKKSTMGLGELYEKDYMQQVTGQVDDKDDPVRQVAKAQFAALCVSLDQLSHMHYRPVPLIEEVTVKVDVPALMMEEAAPAFVSTASMRAPEEVYKRGGLINTAAAGRTMPQDGTKRGTTGADGESSDEEDGMGGTAVAAAAAQLNSGRGLLDKNGVFKAEAELTREDRKRRRAASKRASKKRVAAKDNDRAARAMAAGKAVPLSGRKSEEAEAALRKMAKGAPKGSGRAAQVAGGKFDRSAKVFAGLQAARDAGAKKGAPVVIGGSEHNAAHLKL